MKPSLYSETAVVLSHRRENRQLRTHAALPSFFSHSDTMILISEVTTQLISLNPDTVASTAIKEEDKVIKAKERDAKVHRPNVFVSFLFDQRDE